MPWSKSSTKRGNSCLHFVLIMSNHVSAPCMISIEFMLQEHLISKRKEVHMFRGHSHLVLYKFDLYKLHWPLEDLIQNIFEVFFFYHVNNLKSWLCAQNGRNVGFKYLSGWRHVRVSWFGKERPSASVQAWLDTPGLWAGPASACNKPSWIINSVWIFITSSLLEYYMRSPAEALLSWLMTLTPRFDDTAAS